jgi:hypothetical protein
MVKLLKKSNVSVRPFVTFKNWELQNVNPDYILLTEDECPIFTSYVPQSYVIDNCCTCSFDNCFPTISLALEVQPITSQSYIRDGENKSGFFYEVGDKYYSSASNPLNRDFTYKRLVYNTTKTLFYNDYQDPLYLFGIENYFGSGSNFEKRIIHNKIRTYNISNHVYGEKIQPHTFYINDFSDFDQAIYAKDDGLTNLTILNKLFNSYEKIEPNHIYSGSTQFYDPENDRFGYVVASWKDYILVGSPMDVESNTFGRSGAAHIFKWDSEENRYRFVRKFYSPYTRNGISQELYHDSSNTLLTEFNNILLLNDDYSLNDRFGKTLDVDSENAVIGA